MATVSTPCTALVATAKAHSGWQSSLCHVALQIKSTVERRARRVVSVALDDSAESQVSLSFLHRSMVQRDALYCEGAAVDCGISTIKNNEAACTGEATMML